MLQALAALFGAAFTVAACYAAGALLIARVTRGIGTPLKRFEYLPLAFLTGAACLQLLIFVTLALRIGYKGVWFVLLGTLIWAGLKMPLSGRGNAVPQSLKIGFGIIFGVFTLIYFVNAWAPETSPDGASYHLEFVARFVRAHRFVRIPDNMYAALSEGIEMLYVPAFAFGRHSAAALVHFGFMVALALAMFAYGRRIGNAWAGAAGALLLYLSPVVGRDGTTAYIDVAVAAIAFAVFYWLEIWDERRAMGLLIPVGLLAGYAYAAKYTAFVLVLYALGFVAWRAKRIRPVLVVAGCAAIMIAPWMLKDWLQYRNPVAPLADQIFRNPYVHVYAEQDWSAWLRRYDIANLWTLPLEVTMRGAHVQGLIGPVFLLAPLALLALRYRAGRRLLLPGFLFLAVYFTNIGARFLIPCLPFFALAMALAINARVLLALVVAVHAVASWPWDITRYSSPYVWRIQEFPLAAALRVTSQEAYLRKHLDEDDVIRMVQTKVPAGGRVFSSEGFATSYTSREILIGYESAFNNLIADMLFMGYTEDYQPTKAAVFHFGERTVTRLRVLQTAQAKYGQMWDVDELRFYDHGAEVARKPGAWKVRAWPNSFEAQLAFDNSEATRWRTWETASPGDYLDVDFGEQTAVDEVRVETSNQSTWPMHLQVETINAQGRWQQITDQFEIQPHVFHGSIRRQATYEMHRRGVDYLLVMDNAWGADDFRDDPESWGLEVIGRSSHASLYKVMP
jgi:hypothetical protein